MSPLEEAILWGVSITAASNVGILVFLFWITLASRKGPRS